MNNIFNRKFIRPLEQINTGMGPYYIDHKPCHTIDIIDFFSCSENFILPFSFSDSESSFFIHIKNPSHFLIERTFLKKGIFIFNTVPVSFNIKLNGLKEELKFTITDISYENIQEIINKNKTKMKSLKTIIFKENIEIDVKH